MRKLQLSDWASIAELISAIAVVISLLYVGFQVSENTNEIRAANRQVLVTRTQNGVLAVATNPELAAAVAQAASGGTLTPLEMTQYRFFVRGLMKDMEESYLLYREGRLNEEYWNTRAAILLAYMAQTPLRDIYRRDKALGIYHRDFVHWLDQSIQ